MTKAKRKLYAILAVEVFVVFYLIACFSERYIGNMAGLIAFAPIAALVVFIAWRVVDLFNGKEMKP